MWRPQALPPDASEILVSSLFGSPLDGLTYAHRQLPVPHSRVDHLAPQATGSQDPTGGRPLRLELSQGDNLREPHSRAKIASRNLESSWLLLPALIRFRFSPISLTISSRRARTSSCACWTTSRHRCAPSTARRSSISRP